MSSPKTILPTDQNQILTHANLISIGERIRYKNELRAEDEKQRAIRCTEDVVHREERARSEEELAEAKGRWKDERAQLFQEAHQSQLRAIARQNMILEVKLKKEFAAKLAQVEEEHRQNVLQTVEQTWKEAEKVKESAIAETRLEEQGLAGEEAKRVADRVAGEKEDEAEEAAREKERALEQQRVHFKQVQDRALEAQKRQMEEAFDERMSDVCSDYDLKLADLQTRYDEQLAMSRRLEAELRDMTDQKNNWKVKYEKLKIEFSDFIDQFPGFRGEFILK